MLNTLSAYELKERIYILFFDVCDEHAVCSYTYEGEEKELVFNHIEIAEKLLKYGFINKFTKTDPVNVTYTKVKEERKTKITKQTTTETITEYLQDYLRRFTWFEWKTFVASYMISETL